MKHFHILIFMLFISALSTAQSYQISGKVLDEENTPLLGATVVILDKIDSTMTAFGITDDDGNYLLYDIPGGEHILQISYTGYSDFSELKTIEGSENRIEMGTTRLAVSSAVLEEVSIKAEHIPMGIYGDTINYNVSAFKTRPGASVEDLLKKLPGIEVARDGSIKAQGKDVQNVLVDGKEFFSGDATIATKNLEAESLDKVQVYDKKSEEAEFTGIDDGQEEKTINLQLKEGYKDGGFGKLAVDAGTEDTRNAKLNYNRFSPSVQASVIANTNNINQQAFSFGEYVDFMGGFQNVMAVGFGGMQMSPGQQEKQGITDQSSIGTNLNMDVSKKVQLNANYLFAKSDVTLNQSGITENFTDDLNFSTIDTSSALNQTINHRFNSKLKFNPNKYNSFTLNAGFFSLANDDLNSASTDYLIDKQVQNSSWNNLISKADSYSWSADLIYKRKFEKKGRSWISSLNYDRVSRNEETEIDNLFNNLMIDERLTQFQEFNNKSETITGNSKYSEPLGNNVYLGLNYDLQWELQTPTREYYNRIAEDLVLDTESSGLFERDWMYHRLGTSLKRNRKKLKMDFGLNWMFANLKASDREMQLNLKEDFSYLLPSMSLKLDMKNSKSLGLNYFTGVTAPSLSQLVTQINNLNPNYVILGNPELEPEYMHTIGLNYSAFDQFNFSNLFANLNFSFSPNKIMNSRFYRSDLVTEIKPINANDYFSFSGYAHKGAPIRKLGIKYNLSTNFAYNQYKTLINNQLNNISSGSLSLNFGIENRDKDIIDIAGGLRINLSAFSNEFNSNFNEPFVNYSWYTDISLTLPKGFTADFSYDYRTYNGAFFGEDQVLHLLDAKISKQFLDNKFSINFTAHDIFNQNRGIDRSGSVNTLRDSRYNTLGRYFMLGLSYRLGLVKDKGFGMEID